MNWVNKISIGVSLVSFGIVALLSISNFYTNNKLKFLIKDDSLSEVMGVIKPNAVTGEWEILNDVDHESSGINKIEVYSDRIEVFYNFKFEKIISAAVTPDESMILDHMNTGASVGLDRVVIYTAKDGVLTNPSEIKSNDKNIWIYI